jgi:tRNA pseudouridine32 synthase/23S rRNA pseudouridine746 synthase
VDKPPGRIVIPGRGGPERTVLDEAAARFGKLWVVHRLDRGTSGVLLFARSAAAHRALNLAFDSRAVEKRYLAIVRGAPADDRRVTAWIAPGRKGRMRFAAEGDDRAKPAATRVRVVERFPGAGLALVECAPETGRTHQIRVHRLAEGTPLAFDPDYGDEVPLRDEGGVVLLARTPLHAASVALAHPVTGAPLFVEEPLPDDMQRVVRDARRR